VVYLQASPEKLVQRVHQRGRAEDHAISEQYLQEICRAYNHYYFHYTRTPLLVVNATDLDLTTRTDQVDDLLKQIEGMGKGTRYYVPLVEST
jgi:deoxyadenosine/deoxycytidine kinase